MNASMTSPWVWISGPKGRAFMWLLVSKVLDPLIRQTPRCLTLLDFLTTLRTESTTKLKPYAGSAILAV